MDRIKTSRTFSILALAIITVIFLFVISPLKGLSILTFPLILLGIGMWFGGLIVLIIGLINLKDEKHQKSTLIIAILSIIGFIPIGYAYIGISGELRNRITVDVINQSDTELHNVLIYGAGDLFEGKDTLKMDNLKKGQTIRFKINPSTKPQKGGGKKGDIKMEFEKDHKRVIIKIAGEFSVYPYKIQQKWEVVINDDFLNND